MVMDRIRQSYPEKFLPEEKIFDRVQKGGRLFVGYEIDDIYVRLAEERIRSFVAEFGQPNPFSDKNWTVEGQP